MKFKSLRKWKNKEELEGLLFFAQRLDELLFDFTLDTYKPSALNAPFLCLEALTLIAEIEGEVIDRNNLKHVLEELEWSLKKDLVVKRLIDLDISDYILLGETDSLQNVKIRLELLFNRIEPSKYLYKTFDLIFESIEDVKKKDINFLAGTLITTLINQGYHQTYLHNTVEDFFFYGDEETIDSKLDLHKLFIHFRLEKKQYEVAFRVSSLIKEISDSCEAFDLKILDVKPETYKTEFKLHRDDVYVVSADVITYDPYKAREEVERRLEKVKNLYVLFHHKKGINWNEEAFILCKTAQREFLIKRPLGPMKKGFDLKAEKAAIELNRFIKNFGLASSSFVKFDRVVDFHGSAIANEIVEYQLINLWTSLETIIPANSTKSKIANIVDSLMPFLILTYTKKLILRFTSDLMNWNSAIVKSVLRKIPDSKGLALPERVLMLLQVVENKS
ncbi:MAG TPA: hypothetical protein DCZ75_02245, partial [Geobacter sp.]|nr:hypothetical protein [Geobacter sp.]